MQRRHRLSRSRDFDAVYRQGRSVSTRFLVLYWFAREDEEDEPRLGLAVPKAAGGAVVRNRIKRQLREAWRALLADRVDPARLRPRRPARACAEAAEARGSTGSRERVDEVLGEGARRERASAFRPISASASSTRYRYTLRRALPARRCKYHPSCSQYALDALREHGLVRGSCSPAGGCSAATPGATAGSTTCDQQRSSEARALVALLAPLEDAADLRSSRPPRRVGLPWAWSIVALTVIVRMLLVPLTVGRSTRCRPPGAHAGDEGDPAEVQGRPAEAQNEELMKFYRENKHQPGRVVPAAPRADPGLHRALLRAQRLRDEILPQYPGADLELAATSSEHHRERERALVGLPAARRSTSISQVASTLLHVDDDGKAQRTLHAGPAARVRLVRPRTSRPAWSSTG